MKRGLVLYGLLFLAAISVRANVLVNPGFEDGDLGQITIVPIPGWSTWNNSGYHHSDAERIIDTKAVKLWWTDSGIYQNFTAVEGHTYRMSGYMLHHTSDALRLKNGICDKTGELHAEWYDAANALLREDVIGILSIADPTNVWKYCWADLVAPAGAVQGRYLIRMYQPTDGDGSVNYDDASVYDLADAAKPYNPSPADGATVTLDLAQLSWQSHDPNDVFTYTVYLEAEGTVVDPNFYTAPIAVNITTNLVNLTEAGVTLQDNKIYTWRVDTTDPNDGSPLAFTGPVWSFQIGDVAPVVSADNQYVWLVSGAGNFTLSGSYTDDGKSTITRAEFVEGTHEKAGGTIVTMGTQVWDPVAQTVTVGVTVENPVEGQTATGWYGFTLEVDDGAGTGSAAVHAGVYGTCLEAALADPADQTIETNWPDGQHGDINGDCKTDLEDLAVFATSWIDCMTSKAGCNP